MKRDMFGCRPARSHAARRRPLRPGVERLEGRAVPASYTASGVADLITALNAANQTREADTITLAAGGTFTLTAVNNTTDGPTGLPFIAAGEDLTIVGNGAVIERSTAAGTPAFRLFDVAAGGSLRLQNLTLQGGLSLGNYSAGGAPQGQGGAVCNRGALALRGVTVQNSTAQGANVFLSFGGGFLPPGPGTGGGVYSEGTLTLEASTVRDNSAIGGRGKAPDYYTTQIPGGNGLGGGLYIAGGTASISGTTVTGNTASGGAGGNGSPGPGPKTDNGGIDGGPGPATPGGDGGDGLGGGVYTAGGMLTLRQTIIESNTAVGGADGAGGKQQPDGHAGQGIGGGLSIDVTATASLDSYTVDHLKRNKASTKDRDIHGSYTLIA